MWSLTSDRAAVCPYPQVAVSDGGGSIDDASNFFCGRGARHDDHDDD
jgi:hypothetical protein